MDRREFMVGAGAAALASGAAAQAPSGSEDARLRATLDRFFYDRLQDNPEGATGFGLDTGERAELRSRLSDRSAAGRARELARAKAERAELRRFDAKRLSEAARLDHAVVDYQLDRSIRGGERFAYGSGSGRYAP